MNAKFAKEKLIKPTSLIVDTNSLSDAPFDANEEDLPTIKDVIIAAYIVSTQLEFSDTILFQTFIKSSTSSSIWYSTPEYFDINDLKPNELLQIDTSQPDFCSGMIGQNLLRPIMQNSNFTHCIALYNSYLISGPILEERMRNFKNVTLKGDNGVYEMEFENNVQSNYSIINCGKGVFLLASDIKVLCLLVQLYCHLKMQNHLKVLQIQDHLEGQSENAVDFENWLAVNFEQQMRLIEAHNVNVGYDFKHIDPYLLHSNNSEDDDDRDFHASDVLNAMPNDSLFGEKDSSAINKRKNSSSISAPLCDFSSEYKKVSTLGKRFSLKHGIDTSREWVRIDELKKYGPEVMDEIKRSSAANISLPFDEKNSLMSSTLSDKPIIARTPTYTGEKCLEPQNILEDVKHKHSIMKQASIMDSDDKVTPGPQSTILASENLDMLHRVSTESAKNLSHVINSSFDGTERKASRGIVDWNAKRNSTLNSLSVSNPFKDITNQQVNEYLNRSTTNAINDSDSSKKLNLDLNYDASVTNSSSNSDSSEADTSKGEFPSKFGTIDRNSTLGRKFSKRKSFKHALKRMLRKHDTPQTVKVTNLDSIELNEDPNHENIQENSEFKRKKKSFKRFFSFDKS